MHPAAAAGIAVAAALAVAACSPFGGSVETSISVRCPDRLVTVNKGERPAMPKPGADNFADLYAFAEGLGAYTDKLELQESAREAQVAECRELAED